MSIVEELKQVVQTLPPHKQLEVLTHAKTLQRDVSTFSAKPKRSLEGIWAGMGIDISKEEIDEMRQEMWKNFPREDI